MTAETTVLDLIGDARDFAASSYDSASRLISSAVSASGGFVTLQPRPLNFSATPPESVDDSSDPGEFGDGFTRPAGKPGSLDLEAVHLPTLPTFPSAPEALDTADLFDVSRPAFDIAGFSGTRPVVNTAVSLPEVPQLREYDDPETTPLDLRDMPSVTPPRFDRQGVTVSNPGEAPDLSTAYKARLTEVVPQLRDWVESYADQWITKYAPQYHTAMAALEAKIAGGLSGGTAMSDAIEQQIFDRAVSRSEEERVNMDLEASESFARRGYDLPPVALHAQLARNREIVARATSAAARETAIERARLEHQHVQFVMQLSSSIRDAVRGQVLNYAGLLAQLNGQAIQDAQTFAGYMGEVYRLMVTRAELDLRHLGTLAEIYETELKSALADLEIYKIEMEAAKTKKDAELADVGVWEKKIAAQETRINLYLGELRGVAEKLNAERLKVEVFGQEVQAYTAQVQGKTAEFQAYRAAIDGDAAKVQAYAEEVRAYATGVEASRAKIQAESAMTEAGVQYNRNLISVFQAELDAWTKELDAEGRRFTSSSEAYRARLDRYKAKLETQIALRRDQYEADRLDLQAATTKVDSDTRIAMTQGQLFQERIGLIARTAMAGAQAHGEMAGAAVSAQNTMVNLVNETLNG